MSDQIVLFEKSEDSLTITLNRPRALNALNKEIFDALDVFFSGAYKDYLPFSAIILTGSGEKAFAAGADIKEFESLDGPGMTALSRRGQDVLFKIEQFHKPVIAAVNGFSLGGGCELAMACHMRIASENAKFGQPEVNLGIIPGYGATQRLAQLIGKGKAMELILTGDLINAQEAYRLGLVNHVVSHGDLLTFCQKIAIKISKKGPIAIANSIQCINAYFAEGVDGFRKESREFGNTAETLDFKEGTAAFVEKRKALFVGK
jgi:enoyl-CoA hydratase